MPMLLLFERIAELTEGVLRFLDEVTASDTTQSFQAVIR